MGSYPPGVPVDAYGAILTAASGKKTKVVIDSVAGIEPTLAACAAMGCTALLKLNGRELCALAGVEGPSGSDNEVPCDPIRCAAAAASIVAKAPRGALAFVCWTDGPFPGGVFEVSSSACWALTMPPLPGRVQSPVGAGDAVAGATLHAWLSLEEGGETAADGGTKAPDEDTPTAVKAFAFGLSCGAASCLTRDNSAFDLGVASTLHHQIKCTIV